MAASARSAVVTGANKGIGYFIARGLLAQGFRVVLACRDTTLAAKAADKLMADERVLAAWPTGANSDATPPLSVVRFDLEDVDSLKAAAADVHARFPGGIDAIVHNAGFAFKTDATEPIGVQAEKTTRINFFNTITAAEAFLPVVRDGGRVVFLGSRAGYLSGIPGAATREEFVKPDATVESLKAHVTDFVQRAKAGTHKEGGWASNTYGTSKVAVGAYARLLSRDADVAKRGLVVNWCCPGWCRTDMAGDEAPRSAEEGADTPVWLASSPEVTTSGGFYGERKQLDWERGSWN